MEKSNDELFNISIVKNSFIRFDKINYNYVFIGNIPGLISLKKVFKKLVKKKICFVRLRDFQYNESYTNVTDCFFDKPSICLEIEKNTNEKALISDFLDEDEIICSRLKLSESIICEIINILSILISKKDLECQSEIIVEQESNNQVRVLIFKKTNNNSIRKY